MRPDPLVPHTSDESASHASLVRLLSAGHLSLIVATFPLWRPQRLFPQVPLISIAGRIPEFVEWGLLGILIASIGVMLFPARPQPRRIACLIMGLSTFLLVLIDQHRLQPWAWQFIILSLVLATSDNATSRTSWQWLIISIYAWSAWSKMDQGFFISHGRFLLEGLAKSIGLTQGTKFWPEWLLGSATISIPVFEMLMAFGLAWPATRRFAVILAAMMHVTWTSAGSPVLESLFSHSKWIALSPGADDGTAVVDDTVDKRDPDQKFARPSRGGRRHGLAVGRIIRPLRPLARLGRLCGKAGTSNRLRRRERDLAIAPIGRFRFVENISRSSDDDG